MIGLFQEIIATFVLYGSQAIESMELSLTHLSHDSFYANPSRQLNLKCKKTSHSLEHVANIIKPTTRLHMQKFKNIKFYSLGLGNKTNYGEL
jgi:hypothetical protein